MKWGQGLNRPRWAGVRPLPTTTTTATWTLLRNDGGNRNHWLSIRTVGGASNRDGIGARIKVVTGGVTQIREVRSGSSYLSQSDLRVHFGLGSAQIADRVEIHWPSGIEQILRQVAVDQILVATEPGQ